MFQNLKSLLNQRIYKLYDSCDELPAKRFFKIMDEQNINYLVKSNKLRKYPYKKLSEKWEQILIEYEKLTGQMIYSDNLKSIKKDSFTVNKLNGLIASLNLMKLGSKKSIEYLNYFGVKIDSINYENMLIVVSVINREKTKMQISRLKEKPKKSDKIEFDKLLIDIENSLERSIDDNISVKKWVFLLKSLDERHKALNKIKNGRNN
jgi:hypothetical protein